MNSPPIVLKTKSRNIKKKFRGFQFKVSKYVSKVKVKISKAYRHRRLRKLATTKAIIQTVKKDGHGARKNLHKGRKRLGSDVKRVKKSLKNRYFILNERRYESKGMFQKLICLSRSMYSSTTMIIKIIT